MEQLPEQSNEQPRKPVIGSLEIEQALQEGKLDIKEINELLSESLDDLKNAIEVLEMYAIDLEHMRDTNEFVAWHEKEVAEEGYETKYGGKKYSEDELKKVESEIEKLNADIKEIHDFMTEISLQKIAVEQYVKTFEQLQEKFKTIVTRIHPDQKN